MSKLIGIALATAVALSTSSAFAGDMKKDAMMKKDEMKKDAMMKKDHMMKDTK